MRPSLKVRIVMNRILQLNPILIPAVNDKLASTYTVHKYFELTDKEAWLQEHGARPSRARATPAIIPL